MICQTAHELRTLARSIEELVNQSPVLSIAGTPTRTLIDHLCAIARIHELQAYWHGKM